LVLAGVSPVRLSTAATPRLGDGSGACERYVACIPRRGYAPATMDPRKTALARGLLVLILLGALAACRGETPSQQSGRGGSAPARRSAPAGEGGGGAGAPATVATDAEAARLTAWLDARFEEELNFSPM